MAKKGKEEPKNVSVKLSLTSQDLLDMLDGKKVVKNENGVQVQVITPTFEEDDLQNLVDVNNKLDDVIQDLEGELDEDEDDDDEDLDEDLDDEDLDDDDDDEDLDEDEEDAGGIDKE